MLFVRELNEKCKGNMRLLTSTFVGEKTFFFETFDFALLSKYFDFIQFALHEYDPPLDQFTIKYALASRNIFDLEDIVYNLIKMGIPSSKIIIEAVFMGIELNFSTLSTKHFAYYKLCEKISNIEGDWIRKYDSEVGLEIAISMGRSQTILFENSRSVANKMWFAVKHNLAGALISCVNTDDYIGNCGIEKSTYDDFKLNAGIIFKSPTRNSNTFPLLNTVNEAITVSLDVIKQETQLISKTNFNISKTIKNNRNL